MRNYCLKAMLWGLLLMVGLVLVPGLTQAQCALEFPPDGTLISQNTDFELNWSDEPNAVLYDLYVATDPSFSEETIVYNDVFIDSIAPLNSGTINDTYYWGVLWYDSEFSVFTCSGVFSFTVTGGSTPTPTATPSPSPSPTPAAGPQISVSPTSLAFRTTNGRSVTSVSAATNPTTVNAFDTVPAESGDPRLAVRTVRDRESLWHLELVPEMAVVRFRDRMELVELQGRSNGGGILADLEAKPRIPSIDLAMVNATAGSDAARSSRSSRDGLAEVMMSNPDVAFAGSMFKVADRYVGVTDRINIQFRAGVPPLDQVALINAYNDVEVVWRDAGLPGFWTIRMNTRTGSDVLDRADWLAGMPEVEFASVDWLSPYQTYSETRASLNDPLFAQQWHLQASGAATATADMNVPTAWQTTVGDQNVIVGVIDDGVQMSHEDLNVIAGLDVVDGGNDSSPSGNDAHGTAVAGVIAAKANNGKGGSGVAQGLKVVGVRFIAAGGGTDAMMLQGFQFCINNGAWLINNSWGASHSFDFCTNADDNVTIPAGSTQLNALNTALNNGRGGKGSPVLFAAGNSRANVDGNGLNGHANVVCVAAANNVAKRSAYSNYGTHIDVCAPTDDIGANSCGVFNPQQGCLAGVNCFNDIWTGGTLGITTCDAMGAPGYNTTNYTNTFGGTSSACPATSGVAALILSANPDLTWQEVKQILEDTAEKIDTAGGAYVGGYSQFYGAGKVDAAAAVLAANPNITHRIVTIRNTGSQTLNLGNITKQSNSAWLNITDAPANGTTIGAGSFTTFAVTVNATGMAVGNYNDTIRIPSNATNSANVSIPVTFGVTTSGNPLTLSYINYIRGAGGATPADQNSDSRIDSADVRHAFSGD